MSQLQKKIARIGRRDGPGIGFQRTKAEAPRAMLLAVAVTGAEAGKAAFAAGADAVVVEAATAAAAGEAVRALAGKGVVVGAKLPALDDAGAAALAEAGCDFVVSSPSGTLATAVDGERMGQVLAVDMSIADTTLRALAPLGFEALFVERAATAMTLADQLELVRLASFSGTALLVTTAAGAPMAELRVLRDSGTAAVVLPAGASPEAVASLGQRLREVPPPRRNRRGGPDVALVPASTGSGHDDHEHEEDDDGEE